MSEAITNPSAADVAPTQTAARPRSAVSHGVGLAGLAGLIGWLFLARQQGWAHADAAYVSVLACALPMVLWSVFIDRVHRNPSTGIDWSAAPRSWADIRAISLTKLAALWATWAGIAFLYMVLRYYWQGDYAQSLTVISRVMLVVAPLSIPYVIWLDRQMVEPRDHTYHFGRWLFGHDVSEERDAVFSHLRAWGVKGFFLAFMVSIVPGNFIALVEADWGAATSNPVLFAHIGVMFFYLVDVHLATVGYALTLRPLDAHIREANPYGMAWVAALICYPPFVLMNPGAPLHYEVNAIYWHQWLASYPALLWIWGALLVTLTGIYAWATVAFGLRFSNLTHRGIITHGPYALTRHPAYVSKNLFWWLSVLPLFSMTVTDAIRNTMLLTIVSGVYYWRAKTEEQHLLADPDYRAYYDWAQANALVPRIFAWINRSAAPLIALAPKRSGIGRP